MKNTAQNHELHLSNQRISTRQSRVSHAQSSLAPLADTVENADMETVLDLGQQALRVCRLLTLARTAQDIADARTQAADITREHMGMVTR